MGHKINVTNHITYSSNLRFDVSNSRLLIVVMFLLFSNSESQPVSKTFISLFILVTEKLVKPFKFKIPDISTKELATDLFWKVFDI